MSRSHLLRTLSTFALLLLVLVGPLALTCNGRSCVEERRAVVLDLDGTMSRDLFDPWTVRSGLAELMQAYRDLGYELIVLTGRWTLDLQGLEVSADDITSFLGIPLCSTQCICPLPNPLGGCFVDEVCEEICVPADSIIDLSDLGAFATPELMLWLTDLWIEQNELPTPDRTYLSDVLIFPPLEIAEFKTDVMNDLLAEGFTLSHAYGDSPEDFDAYTAVGIPVHGTFSARRVLTQDECLGHDFALCLMDGFEEHTEYVRRLTPVCGLGS